jgi:hypothetical protein
MAMTEKTCGAEFIPDDTPDAPLLCVLTGRHRDHQTEDGTTFRNRWPLPNALCRVVVVEESKR